MRRRPNPEYRFRHGLVQEVAYASLVETTRRKLHKRVGEALEDIYRESPEESYALLARHFSEADVPDKAVDYLLKAGDRARSIYADQEALDHYRKARTFLAHIGDEARARDTLFKMALTYHLAFDFENAEEMYDEAFSCRVDEETRLEPTEHLSTAVSKPDAVVPGHVYSTEGLKITEQLFKGLLMIDDELNVLPSMADNMRVSSDGLTYLFRLREGVRWSDGEPLTADDFAFTWMRMRELETRTSFLMEDVETAEALDDRTLEITLREPRSFFPYVLASPWAFPWPRHRCEQLGEDWHRPENIVSNGPFTLAEFDDEHALLTANPYWNGPRGNVARDRDPVHRDEPRDDRALDERRVRRRHGAGTWGSRTPPTRSTSSSPTCTRATSGSRSDKPPFSNKHVRKAFAHAVNREALLRDVDSERASTRGGAIPPAMPGHSHRVGPEYDPETARQLLAEAGYPEGRGLPELRMLVPPWLMPTAKLLAEQVAEIGFRVDVPRGGREVLVGEPRGRAPLGQRLRRRLPRPGRFLPRALPRALPVLPRRRDRGEDHRGAVAQATSPSG